MPTASHDPRVAMEKVHPYWHDTLSLPLEEYTKKLFIEHAKIPERQLLQHLEDARNKACECCPYPCIGTCLFLKVHLRRNPEFDEAVRRTKEGKKLLDFGCAIGQDLRSLAHAGAPTDRLFGADLHPAFFQAGQFIFKDAGSGITFVQANALDPETLLPWRGQFSVATCNYVFHLFNLADQEKLAALLLRMLTGGRDDRMFGRTAGTLETEGRYEPMPNGRMLYRHSVKSFVELFERVAKDAVGRGVVVKTWTDSKVDMEVEGLEPLRNLFYSVWFKD